MLAERVPLSENMTKAKSVGVFVDVSNQFYEVLVAHKGNKIAYNEYLKKAIGADSLYRAFAYGAFLGGEATGFIACLKAYGYEPRYKQARIVEGRPNIRETDLNIHIAVDVARLIDRLDVVILGSSNPDLAPLIQFIKERGVKCIVMACQIPSELRDVADECVEITTDLLEK